MPYPHEHAARLKGPDHYERFRRENDKFGAGIHAIWGITEDGKAELQSIRFDAGKFTVSEARAWLKEHGHKPIRFEPATGEKAEGTGEFIVIEAASEQDGSERPKVLGVAYTGGKMKLPGWRYPVVVDLQGLEIPETVPLLTNHENRTGSRVGMIRAQVEANTLVIEGEILSSSGQAKGIIEQARAGADWQLSIGAEVKEAELVRDRRTVNSREHTGPFYHITKSVLREVSVVAVGADVSTRMKVAARFHLSGGRIMKFEKWLEEHGIDAEAVNDKKMAELRAAFENGDAPPKVEPEPEPQKVQAEPDDINASASPEKPDARQQAESAVRAERKRVAAIQDLCAGEFPDIEREAVRGGWDPAQTSQRVLKALRESRPQLDVVVGDDRSHQGFQMTAEAALCLRAGFTAKEIGESYDTEIVRGAMELRGLSLQQLFVECCQAEGVDAPRTFGNDTIRAAFSTVSLPGTLNNVANKKLLKSFESQPLIATRLCSEGDLNDFKESERYRLTDVGDLQPVAPDGELKHGGLTEEKATNKLDTYGKIFSLTRQMIYNDDLSAFLRVPAGMGARAARKIDQLFFTRLMSNPTMEDGTALFHADHNNYVTGGATALDIDALGTAIQLFLDQVDADDEPINVSAQYLLVPTDLKITAAQLLNSVTLLSVGDTDAQGLPTYNAIRDENLELIAAPYLSNANYTGASSVAWYLFADPQVVDTFEIGYLKGNRTPTIERGETDFDTLGVNFRVYYDLGVREQDWRGVIKMLGEAA